MWRHTQNLSLNWLICRTWAWRIFSMLFSRVARMSLEIDISNIRDWVFRMQIGVHFPLSYISSFSTGRFASDITSKHQNIKSAFPCSWCTWNIIQIFCNAVNPWCCDIITSLHWYSISSKRRKFCGFYLEFIVEGRWC